MGETKYYGACDDLANLHAENEHCKNWVPQLDEPLEPEASSLPASPAPDERPQRDWAIALRDGTKRDLSDVEIETIKILARELYDRFVMGGWELRDSYDQIARILVDGGLLAEARAGGRGEGASKFTQPELQAHAKELAALGMCCINQELWKGRQNIELYIEKHFRPLPPAPEESAKEG